MALFLLNSAAVQLNSYFKPMIWWNAEGIRAFSENINQTVKKIIQTYIEFHLRGNKPAKAGRNPSNLRVIRPNPEGIRPTCE
ncbi:hypothetical protein ABE28_002765 [Peribacillus muralis]|uniref:Uncharacterized protein n=1 Tax=Peribacillus muralis TaxID=264697 RepID=A0A1B3XJA5_9BACI|nr:hypothetical protein ABE28_002765 [Peribacillus muralis]